MLMVTLVFMKQKEKITVSPLLDCQQKKFGNETDTFGVVETERTKPNQQKQILFLNESKVLVDEETLEVENSNYILVHIKRGLGKWIFSFSRKVIGATTPLPLLACQISGSHPMPWVVGVKTLARGQVLTQLTSTGGDLFAKGNSIFHATKEKEMLIVIRLFLGTTPICVNFFSTPKVIKSLLLFD